MEGVKAKAWRWLQNILIVTVVVAANVALWAVINRPNLPPGWDGRINGVSFQPYQLDQNPQANRHPTPEQIAADLAVLADKVKQIRTYAATEGLERVAELAEPFDLRVMAGAWIDANPARNEREIENVIAMARDHSNVARIIIGNEAILRADVTVDQLTDYIRRVRSEVKVPVSTAEPWHVWLEHPELGREVDFIAIHILPYWEGLPIKEAIDYALARYQQVKDAFPTKPVVITEVGWPSEGRQRRAAEPTRTAQAEFLRGFMTIADQRGFDYFIMEAFDQPWKREIEGSVGPYWGIFDAERNLKFPLTGPVVGMERWPMLASIASALALLPILFFMRRWRNLRFAGRLFYAGLIQGCATLLVYVGHNGLSQYMTTGTALMWSMLLPLLVLLIILLLAEGLEFAEVVWARRMERRFLPYPKDTRSDWRKVSIHLPIHNEPPEIVMRTLDALARLDYPNFEVLVIDNNTKDETVWRPVEEHCRQLGPRFRFFHVMPLKGFKAGALNFALRHTAADAEFVAVIDSDYLVEPDWLNAVVPYFDRPEVGFVQAPQDHYDWRDNLFKEMANWEYAGFFNIGMVQRNERDAIIQHGTMTIVRRSAIDKVGEWAEWCICEDSEMGLRLLVGGYQSVYLDRRYGYGVTPDTFAAYRTQRFRWAYGAMQILKRHWRELLPGKNRGLSPMQRYHFVTGWMPWVADAVGLVFAWAAVLWTVGVLALPRYFDFPLTLFLMPALGVFIAKVVQFLWLYKIRVPCTLRQRLGAGLAGLSLTYTIGKATLFGIFTKKLPFIRTPKAEKGPALLKALVMAREEATLCLLLWLSSFSIWLLYTVDDPEARIWVGVMMAQSLPYLAAPIMALINAWSMAKNERKETPEKPLIAQKAA